MISKRSTVAGRKTRTRIRKPKYLSLRLQLISPENTPPSPPMPTANSGTGVDHSHQQKQQLINLFPLHPENLQEEQNMACIFSSCDDDGAATTLTGLLCSEEEEDNMNNPSPSSVNYADEEVELVRTAMRRNKTERDQDHHDDHNEKWVCYSEVVERKEVIRGLSSSSLTSSSSCNNHRIKVKLDDDNRAQKQSKLVLKLDYEEIMNAWVDKGPLYIHDNPDLDLGVDSSQPQIVPELGGDDFFAATSLNGERSSNAGLWTVPEMVPSKTKETCKVNKEAGGEESLKAVSMAGQREASVQRYKEKRQNRLFAKTIRYQVRKLNAEKRPRVKGRFVKRS